MTSKAENAVAEALKVAQFLDEMGEHKRANDVRRLCKSNTSYRGTLQALHRDNMALRQKENT